MNKTVQQLVDAQEEITARLIVQPSLQGHDAACNRIAIMRLLDYRERLILDDLRWRES